MHLHKQGILHRDIAARNFLVHSQKRAFVADFGKSVQLKQPETAYQGEKEERIPIMWCAPEVLKRRRFTKASDVFAFGIFLYELIKQEEPYYGLDAMSEVGPGVQDMSNPLRPVVPGYCPIPLKDLMVKCWRGDPEQRPLIDEVNETLMSIHEEYTNAESLEDVYRPCGQGSYVSRASPTPASAAAFYGVYHSQPSVTRPPSAHYANE